VNWFELAQRFSGDEDEPSASIRGELLGRLSPVNISEVFCETKPGIY
jgi:hypothetical protein